MANSSYKTKYGETLKSLSTKQLKNDYNAAFYSECDRLISEIKEKCSENRSITEKTASVWVDDQYSNAVVEKVANDLKDIGFDTQITTIKTSDSTPRFASLKINW